MSITVSLHAQFSVRTLGEGAGILLPPAKLQAECDAVMEALLELEASGCGISDISIAADASEGQVEISLLSTGEDFESAEGTGEACMRTAIHKIGGHTPQWTGASFSAQNKRTELLQSA